MNFLKTTWFKWLRLLILLYAIIGIALYYLQDLLFFHPKALPANYVYQFKEPFAEVNIPIDSATNLNIIQFKVKDTIKIKGVVLYFHGNKENINRFEKFAHFFIDNHYEVWMMDYPTFGKSTGEIIEKLLYTEALQVYKLAQNKFKNNEIVIYGKSIGTGIASQLASVVNCNQLILETPYYSLVSLANFYAPIYPSAISKYKFPTYQYLSKLDVPITIFHGTKDGVIPYSNARKLIPILKKTDQFYTIENGKHNNLMDYNTVVNALDSLLK